MQPQGQPSELLDRARALLRRAGMRGPAGNDDVKAAEPAARRLQVAALGVRLAHKCRGRPARRSLDRVTATRAADLLVGSKHDAQRTDRGGAADRLEHDHEAALHVVSARAEGASVLGPPRQLRERSAWPYRVEMAKQKHRLPFARNIGADVLAL